MERKTSEYLNDFRRLVLYEFTNPSAANMFEDGEPEEMPQDPNMGGDPGMGGGPEMGGDPSMGGAPDMSGDPGMGPDAGMEGDPGMEGGADMGGDPGMGGGPDMGRAQGPEGFNPQGVDQQQGLDGMGGGENGMHQDGGMGEDAEDEEVIDVDDLTKSQEKAEEKIDRLSSRFDKVFDSINDIEKKIAAIDNHTNRYLEKLGSEIEKRNPTPMQRLTMRSAKSAPYSMTPNEYMNNYAPDNYSAEPDNNGADDPQYKITKGDIDDFTDYSSVAKDLGRGLNLHDILGY